MLVLKLTVSIINWFLLLEMLLMISWKSLYFFVQTEVIHQSAARVVCHIYLWHASGVFYSVFFLHSFILILTLILLPRFLYVTELNNSPGWVLWLLILLFPLSEEGFLFSSHVVWGSQHFCIETTLYFWLECISLWEFPRILYNFHINYLSLFNFIRKWVSLNSNNKIFVSNFPNIIIKIFVSLCSQVLC